MAAPEHSRPAWPLISYVALLTAVLVGLFLQIAGRARGFEDEVVPWVILTIVFGIAEYSVLFFHHEDGRVGLSPAEAVLLPMIVGLSFPQVVLGVTLGTIAVSIAHRRVGMLKALFNVVQGGCAAAAAAGLWVWLHPPGRSMSVADAGIAVGAVLIYAALTHLFVAAAISLSGGGRFAETARDLPFATILSLGASLVLGLLFAASFVAADWTVVLFPVCLFALYLGHRAVVRQRQERQRVEHIHAAGRALASSPGLDTALVEFLREVHKVASAAEARVVLISRDRPLWKGQERLWSGVRHGEPTATMEPLGAGPMLELTKQVQPGRRSLIAILDEVGDQALLHELGATSVLAVPLLEAERTSRITGYLMVMDRLGADEFAESDERLLSALADELLVTIDSHLLFAEVDEERARFRQIFKASKDGVCLLDPQGTVLAWNPSMERITGYAATAVLGQVWSDEVMVRDSEHRRLEGAHLFDVPPEVELEVVTRTGPTRWITVLSNSVREREEKGWVVLIRDVSAEHAVEAAKSDFLSTISHELRTPLTTIKGALQVLARGRANIPEQLADQMVDVTTRGAERLERLVMNLLAVSQLESGTMAVFPDKVDLTPIVRDRIKALLQDHPQTILDVPDEPVVVRADRERMSHVVEHLVENAAKFGGQGEIKIEVGHEGGYAHLSVSDNGPGIAPENHERIFERFVRLGDVLTRETQGAGIGLFIAQRSVEAMGGRIWVDSKLGEGATFHVSIPMGHPTAVADTADSA